MTQTKGKHWAMYEGDCVELIRDLPDESIHFSVSSPPFASLFVYSDSERDMGNCSSDEEFFQHARLQGWDADRVRVGLDPPRGLHDLARRAGHSGWAG